MNNVFDGVGVIRMDREIADKVIYTKTGYISCQDNHMTFADRIANIKFPILMPDISKLENYNWFILGYVMPTNDFSTCCEDPYDIVYGLGNTLAEAAKNLRNHKRYNMYPLLKAFG